MEYPDKDRTRARAAYEAHKAHNFFFLFFFLGCMEVLTQIQQGFAAQMKSIRDALNRVDPMREVPSNELTSMASPIGNRRDSRASSIIASTHLSGAQYSIISVSPLGANPSQTSAIPNPNPNISQLSISPDARPARDHFPRLFMTLTFLELPVPLPMRPLPNSMFPVILMPTAELTVLTSL
ncbi:hypothetical protein B7494_g4693 [Chlorociboria aeruginascens]|nr:hypothetical protein B7494_g4693 [Chlorociboria aeruginascens]